MLKVHEISALPGARMKIRLQVAFCLRPTGRQCNGLDEHASLGTSQGSRKPTCFPSNGRLTALLGLLHRR